MSLTEQITAVGREMMFHLAFTVIHTHWHTGLSNSNLVYFCYCRSTAQGIFAFGAWWCFFLIYNGSSVGSDRGQSLSVQRSKNYLSYIYYMHTYMHVSSIYRYMYTLLYILCIKYAYPHIAFIKLSSLFFNH